MDRTTRIVFASIGTLIAVIIAAIFTLIVWVGYEAGIEDGKKYQGEVSVISVPDLPLCDATRTTSCSASKVDWNTLQVHTAPGITRTVAGHTAIPNSKE